MKTDKGLTILSALTITCLATAMIAGGCGDEELPARTSRLPYNDNETVLIAPEGTTVHATADGEACIQIDGGACIRPQDECGADAHADVILDSEGRVVEVLCYPTEAEAEIVEAADGSVSVPSNGAVVILGDEDLHGDLTVQGNRGVIFGDSPGETVIDGDLVLRGNVTVVRGVRVRGNVSFDGNESTLVYCVVEGDVNFSGGGNLLSNCTVFGAINGMGNGDRVVTNFVQGDLDLTQPDECRDNRRFVDSDTDLVLDAAEVDAAEAISCD